MYSLLMELDESDRINMIAFHGPAVDMVLAEERLSYGSLGDVTGRDRQWPLGDHQGSANAIAKSNSAGVASIASSIVRSAFGEVVKTDGSAESNFGFQGQVANAATGQGQFRNRNFSAQQGRFISQDPIQFASGQTNHYQFVANHPHMGTDPSGLAEDDETDWLSSLKEGLKKQLPWGTKTAVSEMVTGVVAIGAHMLQREFAGLSSSNDRESVPISKAGMDTAFVLGVASESSLPQMVSPSDVQSQNLVNFLQRYAREQGELIDVDSTIRGKFAAPVIDDGVLELPLLFTPIKGAGAGAKIGATELKVLKSFDNAVDITKFLKYCDDAPVKPPVTEQQMYGPFFHSAEPTVVDKIVASSELWGRAPRNQYAGSPFARAKAHKTVPQEGSGVVFETPVKPDSSSPAGQVWWINPEPYAKWSKIPIKIIEVRK